MGYGCYLACRIFHYISINPTNHRRSACSMLGKSKKNLLPNNSGAKMLMHHALYISVNKNFTNNQQMQPPLLVPRKKTHPGPAWFKFWWFELRRSLLAAAPSWSAAHFGQRKLVNRYTRPTLLALRDEGCLIIPKNWLFDRDPYNSLLYIIPI